ncbi:MAG: hypothetical protein EOO11_21990, partial [Chitinophagaceae bacterium]
MSQQRPAETAINLQLKGLEILHASCNVPENPQGPMGNFHFNINLDHKAEFSQNLLAVIVSVEVRTEDQQQVLGALVLSNIFAIENIDTVIGIDPENGQLQIPQVLAELLATQSIATARGTLFGIFKGTFIHHAFLPIIDTRSFQPQPA